MILKIAIADTSTPYGKIPSQIIYSNVKSCAVRDGVVVYDLESADVWLDPNIDSEELPSCGVNILRLFMRSDVVLFVEWGEFQVSRSIELRPTGVEEAQGFPSIFSVLDAAVEDYWRSRHNRIRV